MTEVSPQSIPEKIDAFLTLLSSAKKPWFLNTTEIYQLVKTSIAAIPHRLNYHLTAKNYIFNVYGSAVYPVL